MTRTEFAVGGMKCMGCVNNVEQALKALAGVTSVEVSLEEGRVGVEYDPALLDEARLAEAIRAAGYSVA